MYTLGKVEKGRFKISHVWNFVIPVVSTKGPGQRSGRRVKVIES